MVHPNSLLMFEKFARQHFTAGSKVLEIGPDAIPSSFQKLLAEPEVQWDTIDIATTEAHTFTNVDEYTFPIADDVYDVVLAGQVIEHVRKIWVWIREVARVCKPGGTVIVLNPVSWPYHEAPIDCWRAYPEGMKALFDEASLEVILSTWDSLESPNHHRYLPGRSVTWQSRRWRLCQWAFSMFGIPVERAYDTITIGVKRARDTDIVS